MAVTHDQSSGICDLVEHHRRLRLWHELLDQIEGRFESSHDNGGFITEALFKLVEHRVLPLLEGFIGVDVVKISLDLLPVRLHALNRRSIKVSLHSFGNRFKRHLAQEVAEEFIEVDAVSLHLIESHNAESGGDLDGNLNFSASIEVTSENLIRQVLPDHVHGALICLKVGYLGPFLT